MLVTDQGSPWLDQSYPHVVFALPDGRPLATLDLSGEGDERRAASGRPFDYALIVDYAVYAIGNVRGTPSWRYYTLEVEGERMLLARPPGSSGAYDLYPTIPDGLEEASPGGNYSLPEAIGLIRETASPFDLSVEIKPGLFRRTALIALVLVFLAERRLPRAALG